MDYNILIVEDDDERMKKIKQFVIGYTYYWAKTAKDAINQLKSKTFQYVSLDHDLAEEHYNNPGNTRGKKGTGQDVADWLAENKTEIQGILIHSLNPVGGKNMERTLIRAGYDVQYRPGMWDFRYGTLLSILDRFNA